ncbi:MAG: DUF2946 domain-containing protein [Novosphingobium sp.]|nr:DUF2946 domain-containing protein [Novosphingobium sp.]
MTDQQLNFMGCSTMQALCSVIREHRHFVMALLVVAFCIKALIPVGYMVSASSGTVLTVSICSDATNGLRQMQMVIPGKGSGSEHSDSAAKHGHCAFSGLTQAALGGADALLLTLAFAFILVLGLAPTQRLPFRRLAHLRPPLRGPPATV